MRTGAVAAKAGVNVQTLRYYERRGLLSEPLRSLGGHREYSDDDVTVVRAIKAAQRLGFTLDEIETLIRSGAHIHNDATLQQHARMKLAEIQERMADLKTVASALQATIDAECLNLENCAAPRLVKG